MVGGYMKNNKGFTLIELLAVIVILLGISLIAVTAITSSLERRHETECEEQKELAINNAKIYFSLTPNPSTTPEGNPYVTVETLINNGYFNQNSKNDRLEPTGKVVFKNDEYEYVGECKQ